MEGACVWKARGYRGSMCMEGAWVMEHEPLHPSLGPRPLCPTALLQPLKPRLVCYGCGGGMSHAA